MTLPPYSRRREEELRRQQEEGDVRRKLLAAEISQPVLPLVTESPSAASSNEGGTLENRMEQWRKSYFLKGMGVGAIAGVAGGAALGYFITKPSLAQNFHNLQNLQESPPLKEPFNYGYAALGGLLCLVLGASIGVLIGTAYGRRETRPAEKENL